MILGAAATPHPWQTHHRGSSPLLYLHKSLTGNYILSSLLPILLRPNFHFGDIESFDWGMLKPISFSTPIVFFPNDLTVIVCLLSTIEGIDPLSKYFWEPPSFLPILKNSLISPFSPFKIPPFSRQSRTLPTCMEGGAKAPFRRKFVDF